MIKPPILCRIKRRITSESPSLKMVCELGVKGNPKKCINCKYSVGYKIFHSFQQGLKERT